MNGAAGVKAVGMGRDAAHRVHRHWHDRSSVRAAGQRHRSRAVRRPPARRRRRRRVRRQCGGSWRRKCRLRRRRSRRRIEARCNAPTSSGKTGTALRPSASVLSPESEGVTAGSNGAACSVAAIAYQAAGRIRRARTTRRPRRPDRGSPAKARWCSSRDSRHRSCRRAAVPAISAMTNRPSVPGRMPSHSSAIAE